ENQIQTVGNILAEFHSALYHDERDEASRAAEHYRRLLGSQPVLSTDVWRWLHGLIRFCALQEPGNFPPFNPLFNVLTQIPIGCGKSNDALQKSARPSLRTIWRAR